MSETFSALCEFAATWLSAFPIGGAVGIIFGPLRLQAGRGFQPILPRSGRNQRARRRIVDRANEPPPYSPAKLSILLLLLVALSAPLVVAAGAAFRAGRSVPRTARFRELVERSRRRRFHCRLRPGSSLRRRPVVAWALSQGEGAAEDENSRAPRRRTLTCPRSPPGRRQGAGA